MSPEKRLPPKRKTDWCRVTIGQKNNLWSCLSQCGDRAMETCTKQTVGEPTTCGREKPS